MVGADRSLGDDSQLAQLNQPLAVSLYKVIFRASHRGRGHPAVVAATDRLPVRLVQCFAGLRERDANVADQVIEVSRRQSLRLVVVAALDETGDDLPNLLTPSADGAVRVDDV